MQLPPRQMEMLRAVVVGDDCMLVLPAHFRSAWIVRITTQLGASVVLTFSQNTGDTLLKRGLIELDPERPGRRLDGRVGTYYRPTQAGIDRAK
jgi:hypothetical protein